MCARARLGVCTRAMLFVCLSALTIDNVQNNILWAQCYVE